MEKREDKDRRPSKEGEHHRGRARRAKEEKRRVGADAEELNPTVREKRPRCQVSETLDCMPFTSVIITHLLQRRKINFTQ